MIFLLSFLTVGSFGDQALEADEVLFVFRFSEWPPTGEEEKTRARQLRILLGLDSSRIQGEIGRDGKLEFRVWIKDNYNVFKILSTTLDELDPKWNELRRRYPGLKLEVSGKSVFVYGPVDRVRALEMTIKPKSGEEKARGGD